MAAPSSALVLVCGACWCPEKVYRCSEGHIRALSRFPSRVAAGVCKSYLITRCWEYDIGLGCGAAREFGLGRGELSPKEVVRKFSLDFPSPPAFKFLSHGNENLLGIRPWFGLEGVEEAMTGFSKPVVVIRTYCTGRNKC